MPRRFFSLFALFASLVACSSSSSGGDPSSAADADADTDTNVECDFSAACVDGSVCQGGAYCSACQLPPTYRNAYLMIFETCYCFGGKWGNCLHEDFCPPSVQLYENDRCTIALSKDAGVDADSASPFDVGSDDSDARD
jgi:hypothetical protein